MLVFWTVIFALLGTIVASFLNVVIDRLPAGESLISPGSHCPACQRRLAIIDLIPIVSYIWLRGRCRYCQATIPRRILWLEIGNGILFAYLFWHYGLSVDLIIATVYCCLFIVIAVIDLEHGLILNKIVFPAAVVALLVSIFLSRNGVVPGITQAAIGGGVGLVLFTLIVIVSRGGMGWGDVKLAALIGIINGTPLVFVALFVAVISGGLLAVFLLLLKARGRKQAIPFGPFLALGAMVALLWGSNLINWYLGLF